MEIQRGVEHFLGLYRNAFIAYWGTVFLICGVGYLVARNMHTPLRRNMVMAGSVVLALVLGYIVDALIFGD